MLVKPQYAINRLTKNLVNISDVANGKNCNCMCSSCGEDLVAKNNEKIKIPHFSHSVNSFCSSEETYLHFLVKVVFNEINLLILPKIEPIYKPKIDCIGEYFKSNKDYELGQEYSIKNVILEKREGEIVPDIKADIIINNIKYSFLIEVAVTHFCDEKKIKFIKNNNFNCIEINFSDLKKDHNLWNKEYIKDCLTETKRITFINQNIYTLEEVEQRISLEFYEHQKAIEESIVKLKDTILNTSIYLPGYDYTLEYKNVKKVVQRDTFLFKVIKVIHYLNKPNVFAIENNEEKTIIICLQNNYQGYKDIIENFIPNKKADLIIFLCHDNKDIDVSLFNYKSSNYHHWRKLSHYRFVKWQIYDEFYEKPSKREWNGRFKL